MQYLNLLFFSHKNIGHIRNCVSDESMNLLSMILLRICSVSLICFIIVCLTFKVNIFKKFKTLLIIFLINLAISFIYAARCEWNMISVFMGKSKYLHLLIYIYLSSQPFFIIHMHTQI